MAEAISSTISNEENNVAEDEKCPVEMDESDYQFSSDVLEPDEQDEKEEDNAIVYKRQISNEKRQLFLKQVIRHWKAGNQRQMYISFWDYAGQATYYATHQVFLSPNTVYLVLFDLSKDFEEELEDCLDFRTGFSAKCTVKGI